MTGSLPLAIYIHVPFCRQRCTYCHFDIKVFHPSTHQAPFFVAYLNALLGEARYYATRLKRPVSSVFFGGGTPSRLSPEQVTIILDQLQDDFCFQPECEISMELNPEDVDTSYLKRIAGAGITRVSFGVQTFEDRSLRSVKRAHDAVQAKRAIAACPRFAHGRSLDLMLGLPFQDRASIERDLETVDALGVEHISLYMLERDLPTPLDKTRCPLPDEDRQAEWYEMACGVLTARGFTHYEISNFAKPGFTCSHNRTYWLCGDYLGLGPAAHSRIGQDYIRNHAQLSDYVSGVQKTGRGAAETERWSAERLRQERIVQGLRLAEGIPAIWPTEQEKADLEPLIAHGLLESAAERLCLTARGRLLANEVFQVFVNSGS